MEVENAILEITPPGYSCALFFGLSKNFNNVYNSSSLKISVASTPKDLVIIPDGIYKVKYSIKPNKQTAVEYEIMRICQLKKKFAAAIAFLFSNKCESIKRDFDAKRAELEWAKELMEASKYMVEELGDSKAGVEMYNEALRQINTFNSRGC